MRMVHLAPASAERGIARAGIRGASVTILGPTGAEVALRRGIFAMPVARNFWTTYQWTRELRRYHDERMVAVYFRLSSGDPVYVGRYSEPHKKTTATVAASWIMDNPTGAEVVLPRSVSAKDILATRAVTQRVGWTEVPEREKKSDCVCRACLPSGDRDFMRRVKGAFAAGIAAARIARSEEERVAALGTLENPLERARGRLEPKKLVAYAGSKNPRIREGVAELLGLFKRTQVEHVLERMLADDEERVRQRSVESLLRVCGAKRAASLVTGRDAEVAAYLVELFALREPDRAAVVALEDLAKHGQEAVRQSVFTVATSLLGDFEGERDLRHRLERLAESAPGHPK